MTPIGYYTDNNVSHTAMKAFSRAGFQVRHIRNFDKDQPAIFYGILRGAGIGARILQSRGIDFWYVDNGYFDAQYMDLNKLKDMSGKYRIVKNAFIDVYNGAAIRQEPVKPCKVMLLPPTVYSAFMHDTTPEDWNIHWTKELRRLGHTVTVRDKSSQVPLNKALSEYDAVFAFNSMGAMEGIRSGKAVYTTNGIVRNYHLIQESMPYYDIKDVEHYYASKQYTFEEIAAAGLGCLN